jgi:hypothetical protein
MADEENMIEKHSSLHALKWKSPAGVGILGAVIGLFSHLVIAWYNDLNTRELGAARMQSDLILRAVDSHNLQQSCQNLLFFINTSLLTDTNQKITQECTYPLQQTYIPAFAASGVTSPVASDMAISVQKTMRTDTEVFQVVFTVPNEPDAVFNTVKIYCTQMSGTERASEKIYPSQRGSWKPGDRVTFSVEIPKNLANAEAGWHLTFCVGTDATCYPSPNLLLLNS